MGWTHTVFRNTGLSLLSQQPLLSPPCLLCVLGLSLSSSWAVSVFNHVGLCVERRFLCRGECPVGVVARSRVLMMSRQVGRGLSSSSMIWDPPHVEPPGVSMSSRCTANHPRHPEGQVLCFKEALVFGYRVRLRRPSNAVNCVEVGLAVDNWISRTLRVPSPNVRGSHLRHSMHAFLAPGYEPRAIALAGLELGKRRAAQAMGLQSDISHVVSAGLNACVPAVLTAVWPQLKASKGESVDGKGRSDARKGWTRGGGGGKVPSSRRRFATRATRWTRRREGARNRRCL